MGVLETLHDIASRAGDAGVRLLDVEDAIEHVADGEPVEALLCIKEALACEYAKRDSFIAQLLGEACSVLKIGVLMGLEGGKA